MKRCILWSLASVLFVMLVATGVPAGGGTNYRVKVTNPTEYNAEVRVNYQTPSGCEYKSESAAPGGSVTLPLGTKCPSSIYGYINVSGGQKKITNTTMSGTATLPDGNCGGPACLNYSLKICRKSGSGSDVKDYDYGFCAD